MSFDLNRIPYAADSEKEPPTTEVRKKCLFYMCFYPFVREIKIDNEDYDLNEGKFILVPAGSYHSLIAITNMNLITIGIAL